jgi:hypothetical protein
MSHEEIIGKHIHLFAKPENFTPPTKNPEDCICGGGWPGSTGRTLIPNCPCCAGVQGLVEDLCDCPDPSYIKFRVVIPPDMKFRIRRLENVEPIV